MIKKLYGKIIHYLIGKYLKLFGADDAGYVALDILKQVVFRETKEPKEKILPIEKQVFFIFANRMIVDATSARVLADKGLYGSGYTICAVMLRSITMYASLISDKSRIKSFWDEDKDTYQLDRDFYKSFKESAIRELAKSKFGQDAFEQSEFEKLLHGSCYAIRKYYSRKRKRSDGKTEPLLMFGSFEHKNKGDSVKNIACAIILDFLGIIFTEIQETDEKLDEDLYTYYLSVIRRVQRKTVELEKDIEANCYY